jgi:hypothetical protein
MTAEEDDTGKEEPRKDISVNSDGSERAVHPAEFYNEDTKNQTSASMVD